MQCQELLRRQSLRRRAQQQQPDSDSSDEDSAAADQDDSGEEEDLLPEPKRRQRSFRVAAKQPLLSHVHLPASSDPTQEPHANPSNNPSQLWGGSRSAAPIRGQQELISAAVAEAPALGSGLSLGSFSPGGIPALSHLWILDSSQGLQRAQSMVAQAGQLDRVAARAAPSSFSAVDASLDLPFALPFTSSIGSSSLASSR